METWCKFNFTKFFLELLFTVNLNDPDFPIIEKKFIDIFIDCLNNSSQFANDVPNFIHIAVQMLIFEKIKYRNEFLSAIVNAAIVHNLSFYGKIKIVRELNRLVSFVQNFRSYFCYACLIFHEELRYSGLRWLSVQQFFN